MVDVTIIIVSWNCWDHLDACLRSLGGANRPVAGRIIVVDNASSDGTVEKIEENYPGIDVLAKEHNVGFAAANNEALRMADSKYVLLLNPDTVVLRGSLEAMVRFMDAHPDVSALGPMILNSDGTPQRTGVRFPNNWNLLVETLFLDRLFPRSRIFGGHKQIYADTSETRQVDYVQGSALLLRRGAVENVGEFDEGFFMYFEETDWCYRIKEKGGKVVHFPEARIIHKGGESGRHFDERRVMYYHQGLLKFYEKHYSVLRGVAMRLIIALRSIVRTVLWLLIAVIRPSSGRQALSSARGYVRCIRLLLTGA